MDFFGTQKRPFLRKSHFFLSSRAAFHLKWKFSHFTRTLIARWTFTFRLAPCCTWKHKRPLGPTQNASRTMGENHFYTIEWRGSFALFLLLSIALSLSHRKRHFHIKRCCQLGDTFALVRSRMNRGRTQFADAAVWEWTRLKAKPISQRWRVAALKYSDYWWITGKNSHLLLDHRIGSRWLT